MLEKELGITKTLSEYFRVRREVKQVESRFLALQSGRAETLAKSHAAIKKSRNARAKSAVTLKQADQALKL